MNLVSPAPYTSLSEVFEYMSDLRMKVLADGSLLPSISSLIGFPQNLLERYR